MRASKENNETSKRNGLGRREFMGAALGGAVVAGGLLSGCAEASNIQTSSKRGQKAGNTYLEKLETPIAGHYDVVVAGGGVSGFIAALAATRSGANTLLIERYPFLGGNGTAGLMTAYNGFRNQKPPEALQTVKGIPAEYIAEIVRLGGLADSVPYPMEVQHDASKGDLPYSVGFDAEAAKVASLRMVKAEGVNLRLHSWVTAPMLDGDRVSGVVVESKSGRQAFTADVVVDATGDGDIAARAGAAFMSPADDNEYHLMITLMYQLGGVPEMKSDDSHLGNYIRIGDRVVKWGPSMHCNGLDVEELTQTEMKARLELWDRLERIRKGPGMESAYIAQTATGIGIRETRRFIGEHIVKAQDAVDGRRFEDVIAIGSNPVPNWQGKRKRIFLKHEGFDIPYRSLIPKKVDGLVLSGRCISCEQYAFQSSRVMATAMAIGQAAGCAGALASKNNVVPRKIDVKALQKLLVSQNAELRI